MLSFLSISWRLSWLLLLEVGSWIPEFSEGAVSELLMMSDSMKVPVTNLAGIPLRGLCIPCAGMPCIDIRSMGGGLANFPFIMGCIIAFIMLGSNCPAIPCICIYCRYCICICII